MYGSFYVWLLLQENAVGRPAETWEENMAMAEGLLPLLEHLERTGVNINWNF